MGNDTIDYTTTYHNELATEKTINLDYTDEDGRSKIRSLISQYKYCKPFIKGNKLLEIGSGAGTSLLWFEKKGFDVVGIEPDTKNVELINKKLQKGIIHNGFIESFNTDDKFDIIWASHVLEHTKDPKSIVNSLKKILKTNGFIFIEVPNCTNESVHRKDSKYKYHLHHFTPDLLKELASEYRIIKCDPFRPAKKIEGMINKVRPYRYYPRILTNFKDGIYTRLIITFGE